MVHAQNIRPEWTDFDSFSVIFLHFIVELGQHSDYYFLTWCYLVSRDKIF